MFKITAIFLSEDKTAEPLNELTVGTLSPATNGNIVLTLLAEMVKVLRGRESHERDVLASAARVLRFESGLANFNSPDNPFMRGKLAMMQQGPWFANMIRQYGPDIDYGVAPFPSADGGETSYCGQDVPPAANVVAIEPTSGPAPRPPRDPRRCIYSDTS